MCIELIQLLSSIITAIVALLAVAFAGWQALLVRRSSGTEAMFRLDERWSTLRANRILAARLLLDPAQSARSIYDGKSEPLDEVLDHLETIALFCIRRAIDRTLSWHTFYWSLANYWLSAREYVQYTQGKEGASTWSDLPVGLRLMQRIEARRRKCNLDEALPSDDDRRIFLKEEAEEALSSI